MVITIAPVLFGSEACVTPFFRLCRIPQHSGLSGLLQWVWLPRWVAVHGNVLLAVYSSQCEKVIFEGKLIACKAVPPHSEFHPAHSTEGAAEGRHVRASLV